MHWASDQRRNSGRWRLLGASLTVAIILAAQIVALAHSHNSTRRFAPQTQSLGSADICELCVLAFHTPLNPAHKPLVERPHLEKLAAFPAESKAYISGPYSYCPTRAPPSVA
jgi:hypothetical protein